MREITVFRNRRVEIWRRPYQRNLRLTVRPEGFIRVTCGKQRSKSEIEAFLDHSELFIAKHFLRIEAEQKRYPIKQFLSGETLLFFGDAVPLDVIWTWSKRARVQHTTDNRLELICPLVWTREQRQTAVKKFYRQEASRRFNESLRRYQLAMGLQASRLIVRGQQSRWGSCSSRGEISLNWKLMCAPPFVQDYVVVHELAHLRHPNHSKDFWTLVAAHFPDWKAAKAWLRHQEVQISAQFRDAPV